MLKGDRLWLCVAGFLGLVLQALPVSAQQAGPVAARYDGPTDRYPHNIMGSLKAHTDLIVEWAACGTCDDVEGQLATRLPDDLVFEDFAPRLVDLNRDGVKEIVTVESDATRGSRLSVWEVTSDGGTLKLARLAVTDFIGTRFRWLAPIGAADFDGDGNLELAYVEKPHLDKVLKIVRLVDGRLEDVARIAGVTNHAIGQETVQSRIALCKNGPRIVLLDAGGSRTMSVVLTGSKLRARDIGPSLAPMVLGRGDPC